MKIEIRKQWMFNRWVWSCPVCHYGHNIPWEDEPSWVSAIHEADHHIQIHRDVGKREEWISVL